MAASSTVLMVPAALSRSWWVVQPHPAPSKTCMNCTPASRARFRVPAELDSLDFLSFVEGLSAQAGCRLDEDEDDYERLTTLAFGTELLLQRTAEAG